jgi:hypothetical protein
VSWTYNAQLLATWPTYQVRRLIGDVVSTDQQLQDEEIAFALTQRSTVYGAAAECARNLAAQYGRQVDVVTSGAGGMLKTNYSSKARIYAAMALEYEGKSAMTGAGLPYAGGISVTDKQNQLANTDRVSPQFNIGMEDNTLPVGSVGNEAGLGSVSDDSLTGN